MAPEARAHPRRRIIRYCTGWLGRRSALDALGCCYERWDVKVAADPDAALIATAPQSTTIAELNRLPAPPAPESRFDSRWRPVETTVYRVTGRASAIRHEADGDSHLVLRDDPARLIAEVPSTRCAEKSRFLSEESRLAKSPTSFDAAKW